MIRRNFWLSMLLVVGQTATLQPDIAMPRVDHPGTLAQILAAEDRRVVTPELTALAASDDPRLRARAALALARVGDPTTVSRLALLAADPNAEVRALAAFALSRLDYHLTASAGALRASALDTVIGQLDDVLPVAVQAALAIGLLDAGGTDVVRERLAREEIDPLLAAALLHTWWRLPGADIAVPAAFVGHRSAEVRFAVAFAIGRLDDPNGLPVLVAMLDDADPEVKLRAAGSLRDVPVRVADELGVPLLGDRDRRVVCAVLGWFETAWSDTAVVGDAAFEAVLRRSFDRALHVRRCALRALGAVGGTRAVAVDRLLEALSEPEEGVRIASIDALVGQGQKTVDEAIRRLLPGMEITAERLADLATRPAERAAIARLVAASNGADLIDAWLTLGARSGQLTMLSALASDDPATAYLVVIEMPLDDPDVLELVGQVHALAPTANSPEATAELADRLWRLYYDTPPGDPLRHTALRTLATVNGVLAERRRELIYADGDRSIREWAVGEWGDEGRALPELAVLLAPQRTGRTPEDYLALAHTVIRMEGDFPVVTVETERGQAVVELRPDWAPLTVVQFVRLVEEGFFAGADFYRVIAGFVTQGGGLAAGAHAPALRNEDAPVPYDRGVLGMALAGRDTGTAHFFFTHAPQPHLRGQYPVFGRVLEGQRIIERIQPGDRMQLSLGVAQ